ncbi:MAG: DUF1467 family protein [Alphaproteobacteria bacterium]|nr:DUF1467 family protein [Alphaproteobacteria bacterium]
MPWISALAIYLLVWWMVFFAMLPLFGVAREEKLKPGNDPGAPARPRLGLKVAMTTLVAAGLYGMGVAGIELFLFIIVQ